MATDGPCERHRRSETEDAAFKRALASMELLYAHSRTCVWRLTRRLEGHTCPSYGERGWEREWASNSHILLHATPVTRRATHD